MWLGKRQAVPKKTQKQNADSEVDRRSNGASESVIQKQCESILDASGIAYVRIPDAVYRYIFGENFVPSWIKKLIKSYIKDLPDLTILFKNGSFVCVELKTESGKMSAGQKRFMRMVGEDNFRLVRSYKGFEEVLQEYEQTSCK